MQALTQLLNAKLEEKEWTRSELANRLDIAPMSITKWLNGQDPVPWHRFLDLCQTLDIPLPVFLSVAKKDEPKHVERFERFIGRNLPASMRHAR